MFAYLQIVGAFGSNPAAVPPAQTFDGGFAPSPAQSMPSAGPFSSSSTVFGMMLVCRPNHTIVAHKRAGKDTLFEYIVAQLSWRMASLWKCQVQYGLVVCTIHGTSLPVVPHVCINELHCTTSSAVPCMRNAAGVHSKMQGSAIAHQEYSQQTKLATQALSAIGRQHLSILASQGPKQELSSCFRGSHALSCRWRKTLLFLMQDIRSRQARPYLAAKHPAKHHLPSGSLQHSSSLASYGNKQKPITLLAAFQQARAQLADQQI